ncbi:MAG: 30S ribosomal protein S16 [Chloroflexota bacterium]|nr:30S ribosomal protein S16 [Chloroflexota bacterium]
MVKIRLKRIGSKKNPIYRVVVAESTSPRDGRFIESIGFYSPTAQPAEVRLDVERAKYWMSVGAQPSDTAAYLLKTHGVAVRGQLKEARADAVESTK